MSNGGPQPASVPNERRGGLWFGTSLTQFLIAELRDFPGRRVAALRLFIVSLIIALVSQTLHVPPLGAIALLICLSYDAYANAGQSLAFGMRQLGYISVTTLISVVTLMFAGNDAWLLLPLSFIILAVALFHARLIAWPTGIALWYSVAVLYGPSTPEQGIYNALWNIPIIGVLAIGSWTVVHLTIKPQDPLKQLKASIAAQLAAVETILSTRLADSGVTLQTQAMPKHTIPDSLGKILVLLANTELLHPSTHQQHDTYLALLLEIDGLRQIAIWLDQTLTPAFRRQPMDQEKLNVYLALQSACAMLRQGVEESRDVSGQIGTLLTDAVLHSYAPQTNPSILTAMWRALQRITGLLHDLHQPDTDVPTLAGETDDDETEGRWFPAWFGYAFWATHADSLQFGIKFSLGAIVCALIVESLGWPAINTAIPTCLVAAQTSLGADYRLSLLRLSGAVVGGLCAYFYVLVFQSQLDTVAGFALATAPFWALAAWISSGSERIAYLGRQLGFSFAMFVLHDFGPVSDLYLPRDRVAGIFLGIIVMGVLDYALWPRRSIVLARHHSIAALHTIAKLTARLPDLGVLLTHTLPLRLSADKDLAAAQDLVVHAILEPDAKLSHKIYERTTLSALIEAAGKLSGLLQIRRRYRLLSGQQFSHFPDELQQYSRAFDKALASELENAALMLQGGQQETWTEVADIHELLKQSYTKHHRIDSLPADLALEWELRFRLDQQIMELVEKIQITARDSVDL
ncbi:FUSC family protein [Methylovulum psychrotolerans]|uniref:FUSC family protein n=1 Tax=Methylovulum psychrotolerans TaxID=1704499 RepID=A0A1Z4BWQ0_9GAMM|nr:FUSC family protein [Methylovulum psychrotolerans]ASF45724.1 FUSC family protein [Methylovulum psychrotolerans]POZ52132.1 FUSC family protein [Methylovulum psychrotolerans]